MLKAERQDEGYGISKPGSVLIRTIEQKLKCRGMNIKGAKGLSKERIEFLKEIGAVEI